MVEGCRKIPELKERYFIMDPETSAQRAMLLWEKREDFDAYLIFVNFNGSRFLLCDNSPFATPAVTC